MWGRLNVRGGHRFGIGVWSWMVDGRGRCWVWWVCRMVWVGYMRLGKFVSAVDWDTVVGWGVNLGVFRGWLGNVVEWVCGKVGVGLV